MSAVVSGRVERWLNAPGRVMRNVSVASRLALVVVLVALVSVVVTSFVGLDRGRRLANDEIEKQLTAIGASRADEVERYVAGLERAVRGQALTPRPAAAIEAFSARFRELAAETVSSRDEALVDEYYRDVVAPELSEARGRPVNPASLIPISAAGITLQAQYVVPVADDGAARPGDADWSALHDPLDDCASRVRPAGRLRRLLPDRADCARRGVLDGEEHRLRDESAWWTAQRLPAGVAHVRTRRRPGTR